MQVSKFDPNDIHNPRNLWCRVGIPCFVLKISFHLLNSNFRGFHCYHQTTKFSYKPLRSHKTRDIIHRLINGHFRRYEIFIGFLFRRFDTCFYYLFSSNKGIFVWPIWPEVNSIFSHPGYWITTRSFPYRGPYWPRPRLPLRPIWVSLFTK
jgi:hypothetical protein